MSILKNREPLKVERIALQSRLRPLWALAQTTQSELSSIRAVAIAAGASYDAAVKNAANLEGRRLIDDPSVTASDVEKAKQARTAAQEASQSAQTALAGARALEQQLIGYGAASLELANRLAQIEAEQSDAEKRHFYEMADTAAGEYRAAAELLVSKAAELLGFHQALALAGLDPTILSPGFWHLTIPSLELPSAKTISGGPLFDIDTARAGQGAALAAIRARLLADRVQIDGLT